MDYSVTRFRFTDSDQMTEASDLLGSENVLIANITSEKSLSVAIHSKDKSVALEWLVESGLAPAEIVTSPAAPDEVAILSYIQDAPELGHDWSEYDQGASFQM
jgi:hypothetical protein